MFQKLHSSLTLEDLSKGCVCHAAIEFMSANLKKNVLLKLNFIEDLVQ